jgi:REP element-mobilizing transposase RayT
MAQPTESGHSYRRKLPHFRSPGAIYHARLRIHPDFGILREERDYKIIQDAIHFPHNKTCIIIAYVIMPNHAHIAFQPLPREEGLSAWCDYRAYNKPENILGSIKKYSARRLNKIHCRVGKSVWIRECFDRIIRNDKDLDGLVDYIHGNPVKWGLSQWPEDYKWSSASTIYSGSDEYRNWFL